MRFKINTMFKKESFLKNNFIKIILATFILLPIFGIAVAETITPSDPAGTVTGLEYDNKSCSSTGNTVGPKILGHYLGCDPSCPPSNGGCNFQHAVKFILYLVGNAYKVGIALAIAMIIWAGYKIIFAGAKGEDYKEGGKIIKTALIGFAITVLASFIVQLILKIFY